MNNETKEQIERIAINAEVELATVRAQMQTLVSSCANVQRYLDLAMIERQNQTLLGVARETLKPDDEPDDKPEQPIPTTGQ